MLQMAIRGLDTGLFSNVNVRKILPPPQLTPTSSAPWMGRTKTPKPLYELDRNGCHGQDAT